MSAVQKPLSKAETERLQELLAKADAPSLSFARGVFAAVGTSPTEQEPGQWLPMVLGNAELPDQELKEALSLLMREFNACVECLGLKVPVVPLPDDEEALKSFAKGYVQIAQRDQAWKLDQGAFLKTLPLTLLSGYVDSSSLKDLAPQAAENPHAWLKKHCESLGDDLFDLYEHFRQAREAKQKSTTVSSDKTSRNDPCPCGSGKKYKKCCGQGT